jgi:hypothetical protein
MNLLITTEHLARLPLFPLPNMVFFPNTVLPLHVFEERYRALVRFCAAKNWPMAVVQIEPGHEEEQAGNPPLAENAGIGHLIMKEEQDDGRFDIVLQGLARVRLLEELPRGEVPFRTARAQLVSDYVIPDRELLRSKMSAVRAALTSLVSRDRKIAKMVSEPLMSTRSATVLADALSAMIFTDPSKRQQMLDCHHVDQRLDHVLTRLTELLAQSTAGQEGSSEFGAN